MNVADFPDPPPCPGSLTPPATIDNVARLLDLDGIVCSYNEVKKRVEIGIPGHRGTSDNLDNASMTHVVSLAAAAGMPTGHVPEYVDAIADRNAYNPVVDWIDGRAWDGADRMPAFLATVTAADDYPEALKEALIRKWLRSAAAAAVVPGFLGRGVLTLQGRQGLGKTSWVRALVSDPALRESVVKIDHHLDAGNKDSVLLAISHWIAEIGELDSSFRRDIARLKGFLTVDHDRVRRPYELAAMHMSDAKLHQKSYSTTEAYVRNNIVTRWGRVRLAETMLGTVAQANGQLVERRVKDKTTTLSRGECEELIRQKMGEQEDRCALTGLPLGYDGECEDKELLVSLDRIDGGGHYTPDNVQLVCRFMNRWKGADADPLVRRLLAVLRAERRIQLASVGAGRCAC